MPVKVINKGNLKDHVLSNAQAGSTYIFKGTAQDNLSDKEVNSFGDRIELAKATGPWIGSEAWAKNAQEIEDGLRLVKNAANNKPEASVLEGLIGKIFRDVTRRSMESGDLTSLFANEETNPNFAETVNLRWLKRYVGQFQKITGAGDTVPLIQQNLANTDTLSLDIHGIGWATTLANLLYNDFYSLNKVLEAVTLADADNRNSAIIGAIVGATFVASQKQAADATAGATFDVKMYNTVRKAVKLLKGLNDPQTSRKIATPSMSILCNSANTWDIERVVNGQLTSGGANGTLTTQNMQALPVANIIEYDQGNNNGFAYGKDTLSFPGVAAGKAYLFVPREYLTVANKRPLTMEMGRGNVLAFEQDARAWYRIFGVHTKDFLGSSFAGTSLGASHGAIVEITLPADA
jgi:hypothetical protein